MSCVPPSSQTHTALDRYPVSISQLNTERVGLVKPEISPLLHSLHESLLDARLMCSPGVCYLGFCTGVQYYKH